MKTIKIIDLVNKKAKGEEVPKKFKYDDNIFVYDNEENDYIYEHGNISFFYDYCSPIYNFADCLATFNKEIEVIEEKEIEPLIQIRALTDGSKNESMLFYYCNDLEEKLLELIDAVNELKKNK